VVIYKSGSSRLCADAVRVWLYFVAVCELGGGIIDDVFAHMMFYLLE
jgi:hypothetical protein